MRAQHRAQLRELLGRVSPEVHGELVVLAESIEQAAKRRNDKRERSLLAEYERALLSARPDGAPADTEESTP